MSFSFFQVPHTTQQQQSNVEDCHRLTEMFSLNFPFRNIFLFSGQRDEVIPPHFIFHRSLNALNLRGGNSAPKKPFSFFP
jgi:hypothetical protein